MQTRVLTRGQIVLPAGDPLDVGVEGERVVLTMRSPRRPAVKIVADAVTGLPVLSAGMDAPTLSSKDVDEILSNFQ